MGSVVFDLLRDIVGRGERVYDLIWDIVGRGLGCFGFVGRVLENRMQFFLFFNDKYIKGRKYKIIYFGI